MTKDMQHGAENTMANRRIRISPMSLILGQLLSVMIVGTGIFSTYLAEAGANIPTTQSSLLYFFLAAVYLPYHFVYRRKKLQVPWYKYIPVAIADVEANFFVVKAYEYTSIVSIMLLDCLTIPFVMALSYLFLGHRYSWKHVVVMLYTISGAILLVFTDFAPSSDSSSSGSSSDYPQAWIGDLLCVASSVCYAISNVCQEGIVKAHDRHEFLSMLGVFGFLLSVVQLCIFEIGALQMINSSQAGIIVACVAGFVVCMFVLYSLAPIVIARESAAFFNLSLLTADGLALVAGIMLFGAPLSHLFWLAFAIILSGIVLYNLLAEPKMKVAMVREEVNPEVADSDLEPLVKP